MEWRLVSAQAFVNTCDLRAPGSVGRWPRSGRPRTIEGRTGGASGCLWRQQLFMPTGSKVDSTLRTVRRAARCITTSRMFTALTLTDTVPWFRTIESPTPPKSMPADGHVSTHRDRDSNAVLERACLHRYPIVVCLGRSVITNKDV